MTLERALELIGTALVALLTGGGVWQYMTSRRKTHVEADALATKTAMDTMLASFEFQNKRMAELKDENTMLREQIETEMTQMEARHQEELAKSAESRNYFQIQLRENQIRMEAMEQEFKGCKHNLEQKTIDLERSQARLIDYLKRFPQFDEGFNKRP